MLRIVSQIKNNAPISEILRDTDLGKLGRWARLRPSQWFLYISECAIWKDRAVLWYSFRLFIIILFVFSVTRFFYLFTGRWLDLAFTASLFAAGYWYDLFPRLINDEFYAIIGLIIMFWSGKSLFIRRKELLWPLFTIGFIISIGSKENFLPLCALYVYFYLKLIKNLSINSNTGNGDAHVSKKNNYKLLISRYAVHISFVFGILYFLFIVFFLGKALTYLKTDIYMRPITPASRIPLILGYFSKSRNLFTLAAYIAGLVMLVWKFKKRIITSSTAFIHSVFCFSFIYFWAAFQFIVYNGEWPAHNHYDFPGVAAFQTLFVFNYAFARDILSLVRMRFLPVFKAAVLVIIFIFIASNNYFTKLQYGMEKILERQNHHHQNIQSTVRTARQHPDALIIFDNFNPHNYEAVISLEKFLRYYGISNEIAIRAHFNEDTGDSALMRSLSTVSWDWHRRDDALYQSFTTKQCIRVVFSGGAKEISELQKNRPAMLAGSFY